MVSLSSDLFGGEKSTNAANYFAAGLKGRARESRYEDHVCLEDVYDMEWGEGTQADGRPERMVREEVPLRNAMNEVLRDEYVEDCARGVKRWNKVLVEAGVDFELTLPHRRFYRQIGQYGGHHYDVEGRPMSDADWEARKAGWLPSAEDEAFVDSLMTAPIYEPGKIAGWIAPPTKGIHGQSFDYEYVRTDV